MPRQSMIHDDIESVETIEEIATYLMNDIVVQEFIKTKDGSVWFNTKEGMSDIYIEKIGYDYIMEFYIK